MNTHISYDIKMSWDIWIWHVTFVCVLIYYTAGVIFAISHHHYDYLLTQNVMADVTVGSN